MKSQKLQDKLRFHFPFTPTKEQDELFTDIADFVGTIGNRSIFMLKGYAGTGKTTLVSTLVKSLPVLAKRSVLMAPTGRAAKVISNYAGKEAFTINRKIYYPKPKKGGGVSFTLQNNKHRNTIFLVDEASMIPDNNQDAKLFENGSLLDDLLQFIYSGHNCKLLLIGDTAQLPPVKLDVSPALDARILENQFNKHVIQIELDDVVRQQHDSGILWNATKLRETLNEGIYDRFKFSDQVFADVVKPQDGMEIMDALEQHYNSEDNDNTVLIVRSNKRANLYNQSIRTRILFQEDELSAGDRLMVVKNNYHWVSSESDAGFIANGDIVQVLEIFRFVDLYGFRFAEVKVQLADYPKMKAFETVLLLNTLTSETPSLTYDDSNRLYQEVMKDYAHESSKFKKFQAVKKNRYFNALQVKFSYAITCHKSQGGQWQNVFVEQPYLPNGVDKDYLRWLYTAITRAQEKLYLIGFKEDFFEQDA